MSGHDRARAWRNGLWASLALALLVLASLAPYLRDSAELVRLRNALLLEVVPATRFDWPPEQAPADFVREHAAAGNAAAGRFAAYVALLALPAQAGDWDKARAIGRHLLENRQGRVGQAIQSDLDGTYQRIRASGEGYCGDYADVFTGMALAAGLNVRMWAFSFDGFGGRGHIFNEVWDAQARQWRMIDAFHNYYVVDAEGQPVSALQFRDGLLRGAERDGGLRFVTIEAGAKPVFKYEDKAWDFYRRGLGEWYLWWGNQVFTYDQAVLVKSFGAVSRALEQLGGIAEGVHPRIRVLADEGNAAAVQALLRLKYHLIVALVLGVAAALAALTCLIGWRRARRARPDDDAGAGAEDGRQ